MKKRDRPSGPKKAVGGAPKDESFESIPPGVALTSVVVPAVRSRTKTLLVQEGTNENGTRLEEGSVEGSGGLWVRSVAESVKASCLPSGLKV